MLTRAQVDPFVRSHGGVLRVQYLADPNGRIVPFLDRMLRLVRRLEGRSLETVSEALRRQERRVRDASRLAGISRALIEWCDFVLPPGAAAAHYWRATISNSRSGVLRDATRVTLHTRGGWRDVFRAVKAAGLMHELAREGTRYRLVLTGSAALESAEAANACSGRARLALVGAAKKRAATVRVASANS